MDMPDAADKAASAAEPGPGAGAPAVLPGIASATAEVAEAAAKAGDAAAAKTANASASSAAEIPAVAVTKVAELPATKPVDVRTSDIHLIDPVAAEPVAAVATTDVKIGEGASSCLNVESDGAHWGFRNKCAFSVQFAYCTMDGRNQLTACKDGFVGGSVAANGFGILVADQNLRSLNENHDFRWVACQGGAGEVIARLDKSDPPVGRCVR